MILKYPTGKYFGISFPECNNAYVEIMSDLLNRFIYVTNYNETTRMC